MHFFYAPTQSVLHKYFVDVSCTNVLLIVLHLTDVVISYRNAKMLYMYVFIIIKHYGTQYS